MKLKFFNATLFIILFPLLLKAENASTYWPQTFYHSLMTQWSLKSGSFEKAYQHALKSLEKDPLAPELQINLGNSLEGLESISKAGDAYKMAEKLSTDPILKFQARFNQAQALAKEKKIEDALIMYQSALEIDPESQIVKTNIELLMSSSKGKGQGDSKDDQDQEGDKNQENPDEDDSQNKDKKFQNNPKDQKLKQPQNLSEGDVKKILEEIKQQEQRIRGDFYKQDKREKRAKGEDKNRDKDW